MSKVKKCRRIPLANRPASHFEAKRSVEEIIKNLDQFHVSSQHFTCNFKKCSDIEKKPNQVLKVAKTFYWSSKNNQRRLSPPAFGKRRLFEAKNVKTEMEKMSEAMNSIFPHFPWNKNLDLSKENVILDFDALNGTCYEIIGDDFDNKDEMMEIIAKIVNEDLFRLFYSH